MVKLAREVGMPTYYDMLEVGPGASEEEIRQAYRRLKGIYDHDSLVIYTLFTDEELDQIRQQIDEAYDTVIDPRTRKEYDLSLFPERQKGHRATRERERSATPTPSELESGERTTSALNLVTEELPPDLEITPETQFSGSMLRSIREYKRLDLRDISARTKISLMNLRFIEDERFGELPAPVYVRGFLHEIAKYLRLPPRQVADSYMELMSRALDLGEV
ncbi:MAG: hypothetical protein FJ125_08165 [Deltaproteobacteria bacterium]|nr:hypothetical protein [Deltaproteobacteria bacterium]